MLMLPHTVMVTFPKNYCQQNAWVDSRVVTRCEIFTGKGMTNHIHWFINNLFISMSYPRNGVKTLISGPVVIVISLFYLLKQLALKSLMKIEPIESP